MTHIIRHQMEPFHRYCDLKSFWISLITGQTLILRMKFEFKHQFANTADTSHFQPLKFVVRGSETVAFKLVKM